MAINPYRIVLVHGKKMDVLTATAFAQLEKDLGYKAGTMDLIQGSYNTSVTQSAGTHAGGGAMDISSNDAARKVRRGRKRGFAIWHRRPSEGPWIEHVHGILIGNKKMSNSAHNQVVSYYNHRNGLVSNLHDPVPHPSPQPTWHMPSDKRTRALLRRVGVKI